jgi:hypothetical protein
MAEDWSPEEVAATVGMVLIVEHWRRETGVASIPGIPRDTFVAASPRAVTSPVDH